MRRTSGAILLSTITMAALLAVAMMAARIAEQGEAALAEAELDFILRDAEQTIERNLQLGLPLAELQQVDALIERVRQSSPEIVAVDVFSRADVTLFSTDRGAVGEPVPESWVEAREEMRQQGRFRADESDVVALGSPLTNDFGQTEGWIALIVQRDALAAPLSRMPSFLLTSLPFVAFGGLLAAVAGAVLLPRADRRLAKVQEALETREATAGDGDPLGRAVDDAILRTRAAEAAIAAADERMMRLDAEV